MIIILRVQREDKKDRAVRGGVALSTKENSHVFASHAGKVFFSSKNGTYVVNT